MRANNFIDLTGKTYGAWRVATMVPDRVNGRIYWICECTKCGKLKSIAAHNLHLRGKRPPSHPGCYLYKGTWKHGMKRTRIYSIWSNMKARCYNSNTPTFARYGGRGIEVCWTWKNNFLVFWKWAKESGYTEELQIDRIDNGGNYSPENCRWVTRSQNCRNKRPNRYIAINGETKLLIEWAERLGIHLTSMIGRIKRHGIGPDVLLPKGEYRKYWLAERGD